VRIDDILAGKRVLVCAGAGGVGKTTSSAAIGAGMAARGHRVLVVTIDPARRLAGALGMPEVGDTPRRPARARDRRRGRAPRDDA
jgi:anion-transporting  ArsA/GET3 family ATPase